MIDTKTRLIAPLLFAAALLLNIIMTSCSAPLGADEQGRRVEIAAEAWELAGKAKLPGPSLSALPADKGFGHAIYFPVAGEHYSAVVSSFTSDGHADLLYFRRNVSTDAVEVATAEDVPHFRAPFLPLAFPGAGPANGFAILDAPPNTWRIGNLLSGAPAGFVRLGILDDADPSSNVNVDLQSPEAVVHGNPEAYFPFWLRSTTWGSLDDLDAAVELAVEPIVDAGAD